MRPRTLTMALVCEQAKRYWFGYGRPHLDYKGVILHAIFLLGLNAGLRYKEVHKRRIEHVMVSPDHLGWKYSADSH